MILPVLDVALDWPCRECLCIITIVVTIFEEPFLILPVSWIEVETSRGEEDGVVTDSICKVRAFEVLVRGSFLVCHVQQSRHFCIHHGSDS